MIGLDWQIRHNLLVIYHLVRVTGLLQSVLLHYQQVMWRVTNIYSATFTARCAIWRLHASLSWWQKMCTSGGVKLGELRNCLITVWTESGFTKQYMLGQNHWIEIQILNLPFVASATMLTATLVPVPWSEYQAHKQNLDPQNNIFGQLCLDHWNYTVVIGPPLDLVALSTDLG